jgi:hypothetical protein
MWAEAQAHDAYIKFNGFGDVIFTLDQRNPYNTLFAVKYSDNFSTIVREGYYDWEYRRDL